jgi:Arc/MetJ-type ribon-helix-helix transcriptional regulator
MVRPKKEGLKAEKRSVSIDPQLFQWVKEKIEVKRFSTLSHAINEALLQLRKKLEEEKK